MVWACSNQLPPGVLSALEDRSRQRLPRLHLRTFRLRSLFVSPGAPIHVHPYDNRLASSSDLCSLASRYAGHDSDGRSDFNLEAMMAMTKPNLKDLFLCRELPGSSPALLAAWKIPRQTWQGNELGEVKRSQRGSLTTLTLTGRSSKDDLWAWGQKTDFSKVRALKLYQHVEDEVLRWLTETRPFSEAFKELTLNRTGEAIEDFLDSLPPLEKLRLSSLSGFEVALRRHGSTLQTLIFIEVLHATSILTIRNSCLNLQELGLTIPRSAGNEQTLPCNQIPSTSTTPHPDPPRPQEPIRA